MTNLVTRNITNAGAPLVSPAGVLLANTLITFTLVSKEGMPTHAVDAVTLHDVAAAPITATTDALGEFSVALWPTSRADRPMRYYCVVDHPGGARFSAALNDGAGDLSWAAFMLGGAPLTPSELSQMQMHLDAINADKAAAENAAQAAAASAAAAEADEFEAQTARIAAEAAATQAAFSAGVVKWVSGTTYPQGFQVWSPANYVTYRRKVAGAGTTDPSADPTNWAPLWASTNLERDLGRARYYDAVHGATALAGGQYAVDTSLAAITLYLPAVADTERGDRIEFINVGMSWARPHAFVIDRPASGIYIQGVDAALNLDLPMTGMALVCRSKGSGMAWWNLT